MPRNYRRSHLLIVASALLLGAVLPVIVRFALMNWGQILKIQGRSSVGPFALLKQLFPSDPSTSLYYGLALAYDGDFARSAVELGSAVQSCADNPVRLNQCLEVLYETSSWDAIITLHDSAHSPTRLSTAAAAIVLDAHVSRYGKLRPSLPLANLLASALDVSVDSKQVQWVGRVASDRAFWTSEVGERLHRSIRWRATNSDMLRSVRATSAEPARSARSAVPISGPAWLNTLKLGSELILDGDFEVRKPCPRLNQSGWCSLAFWETSMMDTGDPWNVGFFVVGVDHAHAYSGRQSMRVDGVYVERRVDREPARAGYWHYPVNLKANRPYVISFVYRTDSYGTQSRGAAIWISSDFRVLFAGDYFLPSTHGAWKRVTILGWNRAELDMPIRPLLRNFGEGSVWFDDFSVREVVNEQVSLPAETQFHIANVR